MKFVFASLTFVITLASPLSSLAQLDSSYELLLGSSVLVVDPNPPVQPKQKAPSKTRRPASEEIKTNVQPVEPVAEKAVIPQGPPMPIKMEPAPEEPTITEQAKSLFDATPEKVLSFYEGQFEESDPRHNKIEITFAPAFVTNESSSNYSFRNYRSVFPGLNVGANVWFTPAMGMGGNFLFSLGADTSGDAGTNTRSPAHYEFLDMGLKFRQFFGFTPTSKSLEFDILYSDFKFNVNSDDVYRAKLKTAGLGVKMILRLPMSADVAWYLGGSLYPRLQHVETKAAADIVSGNNYENARIGLQFGTELKLSRKSQIFYEVSASSEKNLFDGSAKSIDPASGGIPTNVSVSNTFYMFSAGFRWGD